MGVADQLKLRLGLFGSEVCTTEMRDQIEKNVGITVTDNYGLTELGGPGVSGECQFRNGLHINEDHFLAEIIDPDTGEVLRKEKPVNWSLLLCQKKRSPFFATGPRILRKLHMSPVNADVLLPA